MAEVQKGPNPTDSSSTNRLAYANTGDHGNKEKQEVMMMSLCVLSSPSFPPTCGYDSLEFIFSVKIRDSLQCVCVLVGSAQSY